ncbi:MAG TPA: glycosyltransferase family 2 protein [Deltaproteobacteria bacterium]|nr:glycosyltransferase family 2 protein [Deltaproteobacteria bacterium]
MLSLVVIARNEGDRLARCLRSVPWASQALVVVDTSTTDDTAEIALREGARVIRAGWPGHVAQKNRALAEASTPWILSLDADEWLTPEAGASVQRALVDPGDAVGFSLPRCSRWLGRPLRHGRWYPDRKVRVARRGRARWVGDDPHDRMEVDGRVRPLQGDIGHQPYRTIWEHLSTIDRYTQIHAASMHQRGARSHRWDPPLHAALHFVDAMLLKSAWRDGVDGAAVALLGAVYSGLKWRRLRQLGRSAP